MLDPTLADAIIDRLIHTAHHIRLKGESMRKRESGLHDDSELPTRLLKYARSPRCTPRRSLRRTPGTPHSLLVVRLDLARFEQSRETFVIQQSGK